MPGPPPPPPPMGAGLGPGAGSAPAGRGQLLGAIHKGVALKKTVTNDRSAPITSNVKPSPGGGGGNSAGENRGPLRPANNNGAPSGGPPLAGLFAGGMPKLKPANRGASNDAPPPPAWDPPNRGAGDTPTPTSHGPTNGSKRVFPGDIKNRGPPPQPPPAAFKPAMPAADTDRRKHRNASLKKELSATRIVNQGIGRLTSKPEPGRIPAAKISQLRGQLEASAGAQPIVSVTSMKDDARYDDGTVARTTKRLSTPFVEPAKPEQVVTRDKVSKIKRQLSRHGIEDASSSDGRLSTGSRGTHGKPHLAPRPPSDSSPQQQQRVSRAQSLRAPRSPPVLPPSPQPPGFQSNSIQQQQQHASSTSGLNQPPGPQHSVNNFRTLPSKTRPRPPMSRPPPPPSRPPPPPLHAPPPPPPHRTMPASTGVPTNGTQRLQPGPPPTPARNSSMRGAEMFERNFTWRGLNEFPRPPPFLARPKVFNSVSVRMAGGGGKAQAPQPPVLQLGNKMFTRDTSRC